jgi:C-3',4' desaturase CrtD
MQVLSDRLEKSLLRDGGLMQLRHRVQQVHTAQGRVTGVTVENQRTRATWVEPADHVVANVTVQNLVQLLGDRAPVGYRRRVDALAPGSGAFVVYLGVDAGAIPADCPPHLQFFYDYDGPIAENNTLFVSVSRPGDGRAPEGQATIVASSFTDIAPWWQTTDYKAMKQAYTDGAMRRLSSYFDLQGDHLIHVEAATPRTFARFTARDRGAVGGLGMRVNSFGPFGFANRTPVGGLWLVGDCTHPGEGTAGVSYSAHTVVQQIGAWSG